MNPQFTYDSKGNAVGVFLPIEDWLLLKKNIPEDELPQWQKDIIDQRLKAIAENPLSLRPIEELYEELDAED